jgi:ADP-dependent phosphofructokinase/glucokinase
MTLQDSSFPRSADDNLKGMMTASVVASSKAAGGALTKYPDLTKTLGQSVSEVGLKELSSLAQKLKAPELLEKGICSVGDYTLSATPTILVEKPKTLVGMGDTISSVSLIAGR